MIASTFRPLFFSLLPWHPARIETLLSLISGIIQSGSAQQIKTIIGFSSPANMLSLCQRIRRFLKEQGFDMALLAQVIMGLFNPHNLPVRLILDRTNWKRGQFNLNVLVLAMSVGPITVPLLIKALEHGGSSSSGHRMDLIGRFIQAFPHIRILHLTADREFIGSSWMDYLDQHKIPFIIRMKENQLVEHGSQTLPIGAFFENLRHRQKRVLEKEIGGRRRHLEGTRSKEGELVIVISNMAGDGQLLKRYRHRWSIECMFRNAKKSGFCMEGTGLQHVERLEKLWIIVAIALGLCVLYGQQECTKKRTPYKKTVHAPLWSVFRRGFDSLRRHIVHLNESVQQFFKTLLYPQFKEPYAKL
jgi:hypothetical protein